MCYAMLFFQCCMVGSHAIPSLAAKIRAFWVPRVEQLESFHLEFE